MRNRSKRITVEQDVARHRRIGAELFDVRNRLLDLVTEVANDIPPARRDALRALSAVDLLRSNLDNIVCALPIDRPEFIYYPGHPSGYSSSDGGPHG